MFSIFKKKSSDEQTAKFLFDFLAEMEKNLEYFYVMDQRQFVTHGFLTEQWPRVQGIDLIKRNQSLATYAKAMEDFNNAYKAYKEYESWYTGDIKNKTPENAKRLHTLKNDLDARIKVMETIIITAGQDLEREMVKLGLLKS